MTVQPLEAHGADISRYQKNLTSANLAKAKKNGLKFLYAKATEGTSITDPAYNQHRASAKAAGIPFGAYHFARPDGGDAVAEARHFLAVAKPKVGDLFPCLDFEDMGGRTVAQTKTWIKNFCAEVKKQTGVDPVVYLPGDWDFADAAPKSLIWRPRYSNKNAPPVLPCHIRQFSNGIYGVPNRFPGLGNVDLNHLNAGTKVKDFTIQPAKVVVAPPPLPPKNPKPKPIPKAPKPAPKSVKWTIAFCALDFRNRVSDREKDIELIFKRAKEKGIAAVMGTEGWEPETRRALRLTAAAYGYRFWMQPSQDSWTAVRSDLIHGGWETFWKQAIKGTAGHNTAKGATGVTFNNSAVGTITFMPGHLLTKGRTNAKDPEYRKNIGANTKIMASYADEMRVRAAGNKIGLLAMDFNQLDNIVDVMYGEPFTTAADFLKKYPKTHAAGPIDGFAKWDADKRVTFADVRWYNDKKFPLSTDHFYGECDVLIAPIKK